MLNTLLPPFILQHSILQGKKEKGETKCMRGKAKTQSMVSIPVLFLCFLTTSLIASDSLGICN